ncbi:MAG: DUF4191 family protein [Candidatus Nanopelagicaceae bacterium]|nr:DUF4191 family protein [Candidatus Nanopelagicaceae bacterium]
MFGRKKKDPNAPKKVRFKTIRDAYALAKKQYSFVLLRCLAVFAPLWIIGIALGAQLGRPGYAAFLTFPLALLGAFFYFTRMASSAAYASIEGEPGAAASVLMSIRKGWTVTPAVSVNKAQDMVHRAVGKAGVVLVAEGGFGVRTLLNDEKKKMERFAPGVPVHEMVIGSGESEVSVRKLQKRMKKFPKKLSTVQVRELRARLKAVGGMNIALPKGPMPKNMRMPKPR